MWGLSLVRFCKVGGCWVGASCGVGDTRGVSDGCCLSHGYRLLLELLDGKSVSILCRKKNLLG